MSKNVVKNSQSTATSEQVQEKIRNLAGLPPFPATASRILMECQKPNVDARAVTQLVECEPAICAKVIQFANSPLFGVSRPISSIGHAIVLLGFKSVSQLAISVSAGEVFEQGDASLAEHRKRTFRQSIACAITSRMIALQLKSASPDEAFLCGVMHDVGKLVFFESAAQQYCDLLEKEPTGNTTETEHSLFGICHAQVGKRCGTKWGLPAQINVAIEHHHGKLSETEHALSRAVLAGNYFARQWSLTGNANTIQPESDELNNAFSVSVLADMKDECLDQFETVIEICEA